MYNIAKLSKEDRKELFDTYILKFEVPGEIVEKDFWVSLMLDYIFHKSIYKDYFTFKGGTSLSKCFHIIDRFSEDIDLILNWNYLGIPDEEVYVQRTNNAQSKYNEKILNLSAEFIEKRLLPSMEEDFEVILNSKPEFQLANNKQIIEFYYPNVYNANNVGLLQSIRLEIGPLAERVPFTVKEISPLISDINTPIIKQSTSMIRCISPERTFWEKVLILHQEAHRPMTKRDKDGNTIPNLMPSRYSRHYYDVWKISQTNYKSIALNDLDLLERVRKFKKNFYRYSWDNLENAIPGNIVLIPSEDRIIELRKDFESTKFMINDNTINSFDDVLLHLSDLEKEINNLKTGITLK